MTDCIVCCEVVDEQLACGHWVHTNCIQKSANALQEIRKQSGHPPIEYCECPVCRRPIEGLKPITPDEINDDSLLMDTLVNAYTEWLSLDNRLPLSYYIYRFLTELYPDSNLQTMMYMSVLLGECLMGLHESMESRLRTVDQRFSRILEESW